MLDSNVATVSIDVACVTDPATFLVTLTRGGLAILVLLTLGVGFVGLRRFV